MQQKFTLILFLLLWGGASFASSGYMGTCGGIVGVNEVYYRTGNCGTMPNFNSNIGPVTTMQINFMRQTTFENGGSNVINGTFFHRFYKQGDTPGAFTAIPLGQLAPLNDPPNGDETRFENSDIIIDLNALQGGVDYVIEVYFSADYNGTGGSGTHLLNNGGANYKLVFQKSPSLPTTLSNLVAYPIQKEIALNWVTEFNDLLDHITIERSNNAKNWEPIGSEPVTKTRFYAFMDVSPLTGHNYYRLRLTDRDGAYHFSGIVSALVSRAVVEVYPNPVEETLYFQLQNSTLGKVTLADSKGQPVIVQQQLLSNQLNVSDLPSGLYFIRFVDEADQVVATQKFLKK